MNYTGNSDYFFEKIERLNEKISELEKRDKWLRCLETAGVDNWEGYDYAKDLLDEDENN